MENWIKEKYPDKTREQLAKDFIDEFFDIETLVDIGFLVPEIKDDYPAIEKCLNAWLGIESIFEYRKDAIRVHISTVDPNCPIGMESEKGKPFITELPSIYE